MYPTLKGKTFPASYETSFNIMPNPLAPLFIFQWRFDVEQMKADSVWAPNSPQQWEFIHKMGTNLTKSLENVTAVFVPACIGHSVLNSRNWVHIQLDNTTLSDALRCWELSTEKVRRRPRTKEERERRRLRRQKQEERKFKRLQKRLNEQKAKGQGKNPKRHKKNKGKFTMNYKIS